MNLSRQEVSITDMLISFCLKKTNYVETKNSVMIYFMLQLRYISGYDPEKMRAVKTNER